MGEKETFLKIAALDVKFGMIRDCDGVGMNRSQRYGRNMCQSGDVFEAGKGQTG